MKTRKQIQKEQTILRQAYVEVAKRTGAIDRVVKLMSANYLLISHSAVLIDEIQEILGSHRLTPSKLQGHSKRLTKTFDDFFSAYSKLISKEQTLNWAEDLTNFGEAFSEFAGIPEDWEPNTDNLDIEEIEKKYNVKLKINEI